jgi:hypothetical protein
MYARSVLDERLGASSAVQALRRTKILCGQLRFIEGPSSV